MGCRWYGGTCLEKKCDGNASVKCIIRERGFIHNRMEGEYKRITFRNPQITKTICYSFLEKEVDNPKAYISA